ncbi:hypothetical protein PH4a_13535 [Proteus hauseri]|nr:hypothetical protein PH4a_13535 [Proteus hauseri]
MSLKRHFLIMRGGRMGILKTNYISEADVTLFDVRLSESEIVIYADCLNYIWLIYLMNKYTKKSKTTVLKVIFNTPSYMALLMPVCISPR